MTRSVWRLFPTLLFCSTLALCSAGCKPRDGDLLRQIARKTGEKLEAATSPVGPITHGRIPVGRADLATRVETRLRLDRYLVGARLEVRVQSKGVVVLTGQVTDASIKQRALDLAKSTVGVERVTDEVKVVDGN